MFAPLSIGVAAVGCQIDLPPAPAAACAPSTDFFAADVYPRYFAVYRCGESQCHSFDRGHGTLRLRPPEATPALGTPLSMWPLAWRENYLSAVQLVRCDAPAASRLLTVPEGLGDLHPPGPVVRDRPGAAALIGAWVARPVVDGGGGVGDGGAGDGP